MVILLKLKIKDCLDNLYRFKEDYVSYRSYQYYDTKGKGEDYRETVLEFGNSTIFFYKGNDFVEQEIEKALHGGWWDEFHNCWVSVNPNLLDLSHFESVVERKKVPRHYARVQRVV